MSLSTKLVVVISLLTAIGVILGVISALEAESFAPILAMFIYLAAGVPSLMCRPGEASVFADESSVRNHNLGLFLTGVCLAAGPCTTIFMYTSDFISGQSLTISIFLGCPSRRLWEC
ncbi:Vacuolar protein sorting 55, putative [Angomonas deanei]|uniref:Vacuolar protein sorting 55, putative n=1 Tax=Angomonas deanei TaxID=59799 RepID=A0A7G2CC48_9TRYP|nr:Vacuolar protein sorting 55, putative [Angomonas deanei]